MRSTPGSWFDVSVIAPRLVVVVALSAFVAFASESNMLEIVIGLVALGPPVVAAAIAAQAFAKQRLSTGLLVLAIATVCIAACWAAGLGATGLGIAAAASAFVYVLASPAFVVVSSLGRRREHDAGDSAILWGAVWSFGIHASAFLVLLSRPSSIGNLLAGAGALISLGVCAAAKARASDRRELVRLVIEGKIPAYRISRKATKAEIEALAPLYEIEPGAYTGVLERCAVGPDAGPYRSGVVATPVALVALPGLTRAS